MEQSYASLSVKQHYASALGKGGSIALTEVVRDTTHSEVPLRQTIGGRVCLLPIDIDLHDVALLRLDILGTLHKHTQATAGVVECTRKAR